MADALTVQSYYESILKQSDKQQCYIIAIPRLTKAVSISTSIIELTECCIASPFAITSAVIFFQKSYNQYTSCVAQCTAFDSCPTSEIGEHFSYGTSATSGYLRLKYVISEDRMSLHTYASCTSSSGDLTSIGSPVALLIGNQ